MLRPTSVYLGDNGRAMCASCAGHTAKVTGRDLSGQRLFEVNTRVKSYVDWHEVIACECGKVSV